MAVAIGSRSPPLVFPMSRRQKQIWKVLNWNIRGLNDKDKWTLIFNKIKESGCHVICFQETKRELIDLTFLRQFCPRNFDEFLFQPLVGRSRGILTIWDSSIFDGHVFFRTPMPSLLS
jgi:hypothetical protein